MKRSSFAVAASLSLLLAACQNDSSAIKTTSDGESNVSPPSDSAASRDVSMVRVVNAITDGADVGIRLGDSTIFENVKASSVTDFREVKSNLARFSVLAAGGTEAMSPSADKLLIDGNRYTVVLIAEDVSKRTMRVLQDEVIPDSGMARVRVVHAAPGGPELDVRVAGQTDDLMSGVNFTSEAGYKDVTPATVTLELRADGKTPVLLRIPSLDLKAGTATTIVITGSAKLAYFTFVDTMLPSTPKP